MGVGGGRLAAYVFSLFSLPFTILAAGRGFRSFSNAMLSFLTCCGLQILLMVHCLDFFLRFTVLGHFHICCAVLGIPMGILHELCVVRSYWP